jgi:hypothetical protein
MLGYLLDIRKEQSNKIFIRMVGFALAALNVYFLD